MTKAKGTSANKPAEPVQRIEPARFDAVPESIANKAADLAADAARLGASLHPKTAASLADLVRMMNAYYSNLIEGHATRPREIERALAGEPEGDEPHRALHLEAAAHVRVQGQVDELAREGLLPEPASEAFVRWLHRAFYEEAPEQFLYVRAKDPIYRMTPGAWRSQLADDVIVGRHQPPSSDRVEAFMAYFAERFALAPMGTSSRIVAAAIAHHRFNYIHPFPDGNGRVSRLMSHAMLHVAGVGAHGLWSVSRGLARGLQTRDEYKRMMDYADSPREGELDGRGNLSERALIAYTEWFLDVCRDQVRFMTSLFDMRALGARLRALPVARPEAAALLEHLLVRGEVRRAEVEGIIGRSDRTVTRVLSELNADGLIGSDTPKGPVSLRFASEHADALFPRLFPADALGI